MKKLPREHTRDQLYAQYISLNKTAKEIALIFHTSEDVVRHDLTKYGIYKPRGLSLVSQGVKKQIDKRALYDYYITENHSTEETAKYFNVHERTIRRRLREFNIVKSVKLRVQASQNSQKGRYGCLFTQSDYYKKNVVSKMLDNMKHTCLQKYGTESYFQTMEFHKEANLRYYFQGERFDSSWELALWIYAKDHDEEIQRCPCVFSYVYNNKRHKYFPDFLYKGELVEIKGSQLLDKDGNLIEMSSRKTNGRLQAKQRCMEKNNVQLWEYEKIKFALDYVKERYGADYLKAYKRRK